jgi:hypothetical protein
MFSAPDNKPIYNARSTVPSSARRLRPRSWRLTSFAFVARGVDLACEHRDWSFAPLFQTPMRSRKRG